MPAFTEEVQIEVRYLWRKTVWVMSDVLMLLGINPQKVVVIGHGSRRAAPFKQVGIVYSLQFDISFGNLDIIRLRDKYPYQIKVLIAVFAEHAERVVVACLGYSLKFIFQIASLHGHPSNPRCCLV
jgi:hypothetical protein